MNCDEASILMHALIDGELDAGHARELELHIASCAGCAARLCEFHELRKMMTPAGLHLSAPASLRASIEGKLPKSVAAASGLLVMVMRTDDQKRILGEVVSAHLRSLQAQHLIDVQSTDQHTVKPWFNGRLDVAPPVADPTAQGFTLLGGRLDYVDAKRVAAIVYRRRVHIINLFCAPAPGSGDRAATMESLQGFNVRRWRENGINLWAVSDINADELAEFGENFQAALKQ
jgi:anti-sigma factor RsiW